MSDTAMLSLLCGVLAAVGTTALAVLVHTLRTSATGYRVEVHVRTGVEVETGRLVFAESAPPDDPGSIPGTLLVQPDDGAAWHIRLQDAAGGLYEKAFSGRLLLGRTLPGPEPEQCLYIGPEGSISRRQCLLYERDGQLYLENCSAVNPTMLDGRPLREAEPVRAGSVIEIGGHQLQLLELQKRKRKG